MPAVKYYGSASEWAESSEWKPVGNLNIPQVSNDTMFLLGSN
jgi:hypothetical protein